MLNRIFARMLLLIAAAGVGAQKGNGSKLRNTEAALERARKIKDQQIITNYLTDGK